MQSKSFNGLVKIFLSYSKYIDVLLTLPPSWYANILLRASTLSLSLNHMFNLQNCIFLRGPGEEKKPWPAPEKQDRPHLIMENDLWLIWYFQEFESYLEDIINLSLSNSKCYLCGKYKIINNLHALSSTGKIYIVQYILNIYIICFSYQML